MAEQNDKKRGRSVVKEGEVDLPEVKRLREDLLESFEDDDICTTSEGLDSFMKIFESEILQTPANGIDSTSGSGESRLDLGFLLEASDDELGLPPSELVRVPADSDGLSELWEFEDRVASYDSFEFGVGGTENVSGGSNEYVALDGLFDYADFGQCQYILQSVE